MTSDDTPWERYRDGHPDRGAWYECELCGGIVGPEHFRACICGASLCTDCSSDHDCATIKCARCGRQGGLPYVQLSGEARLALLTMRAAGHYLHNRCADGIRVMLDALADGGAVGRDCAPAIDPGGSASLIQRCEAEKVPSVYKRLKEMR